MSDRIRNRKLPEFSDFELEGSEADGIKGFVINAHNFVRVFNEFMD